MQSKHKRINYVTEKSQQHHHGCTIKTGYSTQVSLTWMKSIRQKSFCSFWVCFHCACTHTYLITPFFTFFSSVFCYLRRIVFFLFFCFNFLKGNWIKYHVSHITWQLLQSQQAVGTWKKTRAHLVQLQTRSLFSCDRIVCIIPKSSVMSHLARGHIFQVLQHPFSYLSLLERISFLS